MADINLAGVPIKKPVAVPPASPYNANNSTTYYGANSTVTVPTPSLDTVLKTLMQNAATGVVPTQPSTITSGGGGGAGAFVGGNNSITQTQSPTAVPTTGAPSGGNIVNNTRTIKPAAVTTPATIKTNADNFSNTTPVTPAPAKPVGTTLLTPAEQAAAVDKGLTGEIAGGQWANLTPAQADVIRSLLNAPTGTGTTTPVTAPAAVTPTQANPVGDFVPPATNVLSYDDALKQAMAQLQPMIDTAIKDAINYTNADQERRGLFNSTLGAGLQNDATNKIRTDSNATAASMAQSLVKDSRDQANAELDRAMQLWAAKNDVAYKNASLAQDKDIATMKNNTDLLNINLDNAYKRDSLDFTKTSTEYDNALKIMAATGKVTKDIAATLGVPENTTTLDYAKMLADGKSEEYQQALDKTITFGKVPDKATADILGIPQGTSTAAMITDMARIKASTSGSGTASAAATAKSKAEATATDMGVYDDLSALTGAPDDFMRWYRFYSSKGMISAEMDTMIKSSFATMFAPKAATQTTTTPQTATVPNRVLNSTAGH